MKQYKLILSCFSKNTNKYFFSGFTGKLYFLLFVLTLATTLSGCTASDLNDRSPYALIEITDPNEEQNRLQFQSQLSFSQSGGASFATWYNDSIHHYPKERLRDFIQNLKEPLNIITSLLQFKFEKTVIAILRFSVNSTLGFVGFIDIMKEAGIKPANEDFGQVLAIWGLRQGDFIILPTGQPSTSRDFLGTLLNLTLNPGIILGIGISPLFLPIALAAPIETVDSYANNFKFLNGILNSSLDPYITLKNTYISLRRQEILESSSTNLYELPE